MRSCVHIPVISLILLSNRVAMRCYGTDPGKCCRNLTANGYSCLWQSSGVSGGVSESQPGTAVWCLADRSSRQLAGRFANDGTATDGQMGGRFGDEGPETVVLHDSCRGTEAARWRVNLTTG